MVVWDIGCGSGVMTEYLAKVVGSNGYVYAIDISNDQIKVAKRRIESAGYKNVEFIVGDINKIKNDAYKKADIVYARFLINACKRSCRSNMLTPTVFKKSPESKMIYGTEDISSLKTSSNFYKKNNKSLNLSIFAILTQLWLR